MHAAPLPCFLIVTTENSDPSRRVHAPLSAELFTLLSSLTEKLFPKMAMEFAGELN